MHHNLYRFENNTYFPIYFNIFWDENYINFHTPFLLIFKFQLLKAYGNIFQMYINSFDCLKIVNVTYLCSNCDFENSSEFYLNLSSNKYIHRSHEGKSERTGCKKLTFYNSEEFKKCWLFILLNKDWEVFVVLKLFPDIYQIFS